MYSNYNINVDQKRDAPIFSCSVVGDYLVIDILKLIYSHFHVYLNIFETMKKLVICNNVEDVEMPE